MESTDYKLNQSLANTGWIEQRTWNRLGQTRTSYTGGIDRIQLESIQYSLNQTKSGITGHAQVEPMNYRLNKTKTGLNFKWSYADQIDQMQACSIKDRIDQSITGWIASDCIPVK